MLKAKNPSHPQSLGKNWVTNFVKRYPQLSSVYNRKFDSQRANIKYPKLVSFWFKLVRNNVCQYGVIEKDIHSFDENGFQMGVISTSKIVTELEKKGISGTTQPGNRQWVTTIEAFNSMGWAVTLLIVFAAKSHQAELYQAGLPTIWNIAVSDSRWTNDELGI